MINLKVAVEDVLAKMNNINKRIITLVFIDGVTSELISQLLGLSLRTFFRKKIQAIKEFCYILKALGCDEEFFESEYSTEKWFMSVYDDCIAKSNDTEGVLDKYLIKRIFSEVSKINMTYNVYL